MSGIMLHDEGSHQKSGRGKGEGEREPIGEAKLPVHQRECGDVEAGKYQATCQTARAMSGCWNGATSQS